MPRLYHVVRIERQSADHKELHVIDTPSVSEKGFYRSAVSFDSFFHSSRKRNWSKTDLWFGRSPADWKHQLESDERMKGKYPDWVRDIDLPTTRHRSIFDFYKHIGYDYKKQKWTNSQE